MPMVFAASFARSIAGLAVLATTLFAAAILAPGSSGALGLLAGKTVTGLLARTFAGVRGRREARIAAARQAAAEARTARKAELARRRGDREARRAEIARRLRYRLRQAVLHALALIGLLALAAGLLAALVR